MLDDFVEFKRSIGSVLDLGCGSGTDLAYIANFTDSDDDNPRPLNIPCTGLDIKLTSDAKAYETKIKHYSLVEHDFNSSELLPKFPKKFDVVWCHDVLQYSHSVINLLGAVNRSMNKNGMLYLSVPNTVSVNYGRFQNYTFSQQFQTFTVTQLIYLLAINGFDCNDFYLKKVKHDDCIEVITYKNSEPYSYTSTWYDLMDKKCFNDSANAIIEKHGFLTDQGLLTKWIDGVVFDYRFHSR
jgi:SAM-dependent methyltransferase